MVAPIIERLMPIGAEEDPEDVDEDSASRVSAKKKREHCIATYVNFSCRAKC